MTKRTLFSFLALSSVIVGCAVDSDDSQVDSIEEVEPSEEGEENSDGVVESVEQAGMAEKCSMSPYLLVGHYGGGVTNLWASGTVTCPKRRSLRLTVCFERLQDSSWGKVKCMDRRMNKNESYYNGYLGRYVYTMDNLYAYTNVSKKGVYRVKFQVVEGDTGYRWSKASKKSTVTPKP